MDCARRHGQPWLIPKDGGSFGQQPQRKHIVLIRDMVVERCYRRFGCETIHPTQKFTSMNLLQMSCVIKWA